MLNSYLACKARFGIKYLEGIRPFKKFSSRIEYGQMWHVCEEAHAALDVSWPSKLRDYCGELKVKHPYDRDEIEKWRNVCQLQFQEYVNFWSKHQGIDGEVPFLQEQVFDVPYTLPSGRVVRLRGKYDSVGSRTHGLVLQENKTKSEIDVIALMRQLKFDLQTMLYAVTLREMYQEKVDVRYNVVRRPLSGGKGTIVRKKGSKNVPAETEAEYYERLRQYIADEPETYFVRFEVPLSAHDIDFFTSRCLDPLLESLCNWHRAKTRDIQLYQMSFGQEWIHPYGCYNPVDETGGSDVDGYLFDGNMVGLEKVDTLFEELQ